MVVFPCRKHTLWRNGDTQKESIPGLLEGVALRGDLAELEFELRTSRWLGKALPRQPHSSRRFKER
jgi:hypothetical protein